MVFGNTDPLNDLMEIPDFLEQQLREGKVVLCLGAGTALNAKDDRGQGPPTGKGLAALLANKFLGGKYKDSPLAQVAEYAISESDLGQVQSYIRGLLEPLQPTASHVAMTTFPWYGIATTNYDRLVEKAYEQSRDAVQEARPLIENGDKVEDNTRDPSNILLLKLHGCITRTSNEKCPLILTVDQYLQYRECRSRLFDHLTTWSYEHPIVYIGQSLEDSDLRQVLLEIQKVGAMRPRSFIVSPDIDAIKGRFWEGRKVTPISGTFDEFMAELEARIPKHVRALGTFKSVKTDHPITEKFKIAKATLTRATLQFLEADAEYVSLGSKTEYIDPQNFYHGVNKGFSAIEQELDVRRKLADTILADQFLTDGASNPSDALEIVLLKAHAGAGKTVMMRRMAWDAARLYGRICLYVHRQGIINTTALQELIGFCQQRIFLFVDDAADRIRELQSVVRRMGPEGKYLTVVIAERVNEWNVIGEPVSPHVTAEYELKYLRSPEIEALLALLEKNRALNKLEPLTFDQRKAAFADRAGRQLLVALHEATYGKPFEQIIKDEFDSLTPREAQNIYLSICVLNRLNVLVRAGVISRIHGISFAEFKQRFFAPLEHVVITEHDQMTRDFCYRARHPHIADMVFTQILSAPEDRYDAYIKCLRALNVDYSPDRIAFWQMIRGRVVLDLFPDHQMAMSIFSAGKEVLGEDDEHLLHQMALYEMHRPNGSLQESANLLKRASDLAPGDVTIKHSMAEIRLKLAETSRTALERDKLLEEAAKLAASLTSTDRTESYPYHTLAKVGLFKLKNALDGQEPESVIEKLAKEIEGVLFSAQQRFPGDSHLLEAESQLAAMMADSKRFMDSLKKASAANPRSTLVALRLARAHQERNEIAEAKGVLQRSLEANRSDRSLHFSYAKLLIEEGLASGDEVAYHLERSFTSGDSNYDAQIRYGRQLFINGNIIESKKVFERLLKTRVPADVRNRLLYPLPEEFQGKIVKIESSYVFIARDGLTDWIYCHVSNVDNEIWSELTYGSRVSFCVSFGIRGASAHSLKMIGHQPEPRPAQRSLFSNELA
jgi:cold shock CspA family protein/tetratricopeptide (TPR) repeat protein